MPEQQITQVHANLALSIQQVTETIILKLAGTAYNLTKSENLVLAGGVALNCVANERILNSRIFKNIWIQPAAGDAGGAIGSALAAYYFSDEASRNNPCDQMKGCYLGPCYQPSYIIATCKQNNIAYKHYDDREELTNVVAEKLAAGNVVGWFQGRMEFGPRALGNRSILADPRDASMQQKLNRKIKFRESFRPFAPCALEEDAADYFEIDRAMPYMLFTAPVKEALRYPQPENFYAIPLEERLSYALSDLPAVTHLNYSARVQTVNQSSNPLLHQLLTAFKKLTGYSVLINTSFNIRDEPIVCSPEDAIRCFLFTEMEYLVMENVVIHK
jgi:carbamoyltransferase